MSKRLFYIIPLFFFELMIQLLLICVSPSSRCRWIVFGIVSFSTIFHMFASYLLFLLKRIRRSAAVILAGSIVQLIILCTGLVLMAANAGIIKAILSEGVLFCLYLGIMSFFTLQMEDDYMAGLPDCEEDPDIQYDESITDTPDYGSYSF